jgi:hypothetical protein
MVPALADNVRSREADAISSRTWSGSRPAAERVPAMPSPEDLPADDAEAEALLEAAIDAAVEACLAGIPRPRYIPATDLAGPRGLVLFKEPPDSGGFPFALAIGGFMQLRWLEFARGTTEWTNAAGTTLPVRNLDVFSLNRYLLSFTGHVVDERLLYALAIFGTSNPGIQSGVVPIGMVGWKFGPEAILGGGMTIVPGTREWVDSNSWSVGVDRSMANTFFRPGYSPGVLALGALFEDRFHYQAGIWNAIDGSAGGVLRRGTSMAFAGNVWWEPLAPFGLGFGDMEHHDEAVLRVGASGTFARTDAQIFPGLNPENTIVRLSDGAPLATEGALGAGSQVDAYRYHLSSIDAGWKSRHRRRLRVLLPAPRRFHRHRHVHPLERLRSRRGGLRVVVLPPAPRRGLRPVERGHRAVRHRQEYGGGLNWYVNGSRQGRFTVEALSILRSPTQAILYPYRAGATGTAIQTQFMIVF